MPQTHPGARLRKARTEGGLKLWDIAPRVGLSINDLSLIERGRRDVPPTLIERIQRELVAVASERHAAVLAATREEEPVAA